MKNIDIEALSSRVEAILGAHGKFVVQPGIDPVFAVDRNGWTVDVMVKLVGWGPRKHSIKISGDGNTPEAAIKKLESKLGFYVQAWS